MIDIKDRELGAFIGLAVGDADTIASVAEQIAGTIYGLRGIKQEFRDGLFQYDVLLNIAEELYNRA